MRLTKLRRDKNWRWRCQWTVVTLAAVALILYNAAADVWMLRDTPCAPHRSFRMNEVDSASAGTCEPCPETPPSIYAPVDEDPLARVDLRLGRWDASRSYRLYDYAAIGDSYADISAANRVCLATQTSIERIGELLEISAHWTGPISVAVFATGEEFLLLRGFATWLLRCQPEFYATMAIHVAMPASRSGTSGQLPDWARDCNKLPSPGEMRSSETLQWRSRYPYPQNHLRNLARKNCHTPYVFLVDIDIVPSIGMTDSLNQFLATTPKCPLCAYVVPTYELDRRVSAFPANKTELLRLSRLKLAIAFHKHVFIYNQYASNFSRWEATKGKESEETHISHNVTNFELLYEPFYIAPDTVPPHDERFLGYGFTRNTQVRLSASEDMGKESEETHIRHNVTNFELLYEPFYIAPDTVPPHDERFLGYGFTRNTQVRLSASEDRGKESEETHISHNVTNFELLYEPFYIAADTVPPHDERFLGYGFTRNTQVRLSASEDRGKESEQTHISHNVTNSSPGKFLGYGHTSDTPYVTSRFTLSARVVFSRLGCVSTLYS